MLTGKEVLQVVGEWGLEKRRCSSCKFVGEGWKMISSTVGYHLIVLVQRRRQSPHPRPAVTGQKRRRGRVAESPVFGERCDSAECLTTFMTFDLHPTIGVHPLVATQVRKLGVGFEAHFTAERFD